MSKQTKVELTKVLVVIETIISICYNNAYKPDNSYCTVCYDDNCCLCNGKR